MRPRIVELGRLGRGLSVCCALPTVSPLYFGQIGDRCFFPTALGDNLQYQFQSDHNVFMPTAGTVDIYVGEANAYCIASSFADTASGGTIAASAGVLFPSAGSYTRMTWAGANSTTITGTIGVAKATGFLPSGWSKITLVRRLQSSTSLPITREANGGARSTAFGDRAEQGSTDRTLTGGVVDSGGNYFKWPAFIVAQTSAHAALLSGDSRTEGETDVGDSTGQVGQFARWIAGNYPHINHGIHGQPFVTSANSAIRQLCAQYTSFVLGGNGINPRATGSSAMLTAMAAEAAIYSPREFIPSTLLPVASGDYLLANLSDQTVDGFNSARTTFNDAVRAMSKYIELANILERPTVNAGKWEADGVTRRTNDGLHPNQAGCVEIANSGIVLPTLAQISAIIASLPQTAPTSN